MTLEQLTLIAQIVGVFAVAATLIYRTIQVRLGAGQMRTRAYEWLQYKNGAITNEQRETYRGVIYFVRGAPRGRAPWALCRGYFNTSFAGMVDGMMAEAPPIDLRDRLQAVE